MKAERIGYPAGEALTQMGIACSPHHNGLIPFENSRPPLKGNLYLGFLSFVARDPRGIWD